MRFKRHIEGESWLLINDLLAKRDDHDPDNCWFIPDSYSDNTDESYAYDRTMHGPQYGMSFQTVIGGMLYNIDTLAAAGVDEPVEGWRYDDLFEAAKRVTDPDTGIYGLNADRDEQFYVFPAAFGYNDEAERPRGRRWLTGEGTGARRRPAGVDVDCRSDLRAWGGLHSRTKARRGGRVRQSVRGRQAGFLDRRARLQHRVCNSADPGPIPVVAGSNGLGQCDRSRQLGAERPGASGGAVRHHDRCGRAGRGLGPFLAGPELQGRAGIDRGHMPCFKAVADDAAATAPPPEGVHHLFSYPESPYVRHDRWYVPGGNFHELRAEWRPVLDKALVGEVDAVQSMLDAAEKVNRLLARWQEQLDKGDVSR